MGGRAPRGNHDRLEAAAGDEAASTREQQTGEGRLRADRIGAGAGRAAQLPWEMQRASDDEESWAGGGRPLADGAAPITVINMDTLYEGGRCEAAGCLAGLTLTMFPRRPGGLGRRRAVAAAQGRTAHPRTRQADRAGGLRGPQQRQEAARARTRPVLHALERAAAGAVGADVWK